MQLSISALATVLSGIKQLKSYMLETLCWTGGSNGIQPVKICSTNAKKFCL